MIEIFKQFGMIDVLDILIISFVIYNILLLLKGTMAFRMLLGILLILILASVSTFFGLKTTSWALNNFSGYLFITLVVIFQPEIRRALALIGETKVFGNSQDNINVVIDEITKASTVLANRQIGALIVIERNTDIGHFVQSGTVLDSAVNKDLLVSLFIPYSPLHDGAVVISKGKVKFAGSILPLTKREDIDRKFGTRHRAAIGVTEETDAVSVVVSEERGTISVAFKGTISSELSVEMLKDTLHQIFKLEAEEKKQAEENA